MHRFNLVDMKKDLDLIKCQVKSFKKSTFIDDGFYANLYGGKQKVS